MWRYDPAMSDTYLQLVRGLGRITPYGRTTASPVAVRNKATLLALALLADDDGTCVVGVGALSELIECGDPAEIRKSLRFLQDEGFLTSVAQVSAPNEYRLQRPVLEDRQLDRLLRANDSVYQLVDHGLATQPLNVLLRSPLTTVAAVGTEVDRYLQLPDHERNGFHKHLAHRLGRVHLGAVGGQQILDAYAAWKASRVTTEDKQ